ncbi:MAG: P-II family nitrogen regulator [Clostridia bacterium]|nr:P-II family nitrogen regulator [Clostridia bacterium]
MSNRICALFSIVDYSKSEELAHVFNSAKAPISVSTHGFGCADSSMFEYLGFGENKKSIMISIISSERANYIFDLAEEKINISKPGKGIMFTVPLTSATSFLSGIVKKDDETQPKITKEKDFYMSSEHQYELVITIITRGYFQDVKTAAISAGARGGTLIHALGMGAEEAQKFLGIAIQPEKEIILNVVKREDKNKVMNAIAEASGINTQGRGIIFSLPVDCVVGLNKAAQTEENEE